MKSFRIGDRVKHNTDTQEMLISRIFTEPKPVKIKIPSPFGLYKTEIREVPTGYVLCTWQVGGVPLEREYHENELTSVSYD